MIKNRGSLENAKSTIRELYEQDVDVIVNLGRNRFASYFGVVTDVYPSLFTVSPSDGFCGKTTYSYSELMCGNVSVNRRDKRA